VDGRDKPGHDEKTSHFQAVRMSPSAKIFRFGVWLKQLPQMPRERRRDSKLSTHHNGEKGQSGRDACAKADTGSGFAVANLLKRTYSRRGRGVA
jgi:hypothetical protein